MTVNPTNPEQKRALVVDDDADIRGLLRATLESQGFLVVEVPDGTSALETAKDFKPDFVTLDLAMPGIDGIETCRRMREFCDAYIMMITALADEADMLIGLEAGADDYLVKPFSVREVKARTAVLFRRSRSLSETGTEAITPSVAHKKLFHGPLCVDVDSRRVYKDNDELQLTRTEFDLLVLLMEDPAKVCTRERLLTEVWGGDWVGDLRLVEVHVGNLRRKLTALNENPLIDTVRGVGYRMSAALPAVV